MIQYAPKSPNLKGFDLSIDFNNMMVDHLGAEHGISISEMEGMEQKVSTDLHATFQQQREDGRMSFLELPYEMEVISKVKDLAEYVRGSFDNFVLFGIGGSGLGSICLHSALNDPQYNLLDAGDRGGCPRMFFCDNIDPNEVSRLLGMLDLERTVFNVISKSGSTVETLSQFLIVRDRLKKELGPKKMKNHIIITTDPHRGDLRAICNADDFEGLVIPEEIGGRYSVLTPVGLFPAAVSGIDIDGIIGGARAMDLRCRRHSVWENPGYLCSVLNYLANTKRGKHVLVMMPYTNALLRLTEWFCQLHAESLGKDGKGQTPISALGATDQHSQLQLYLDGPNDKVINFISVDRYRHEENIPETPQEYRQYPAVNYLGGHALKKVFQVERLATESALTHRQRPNFTINLPILCAETVGQMIYLLELQTAFSGLLYGVNPFDQPAVELGKRMAYHLLGRKEYHEKPAELLDFEKKNQRYII